MKALVKLGTALVLSVFSLAAAHAAPAPASAKAELQRGLKNAKKAQQGERAHADKVRARKAAAYAARQQAMGGKASGVQ